MIEYSQAPDYADRALRITLRTDLPADQLLEWPEKKGRITRACMAKLVRQQWPAGEALEKAWAQTASDWTVVSGREVVGVNQSLADQDSGRECKRQASPRRASDAPSARGLQPPPRRRQAIADGGGAGKGGSGAGKGGSGAGGGKRPAGPSDPGPGKKYKIGVTSTQLRDGTKICGAFNSKRGCVHESRCPQWGAHRCSYIIREDGTVCGARDHGAADHKRR